MKKLIKLKVIVPLVVLVAIIFIGVTTIAAMVWAMEAEGKKPPTPQD